MPVCFHSSHGYRSEVVINSNIICGSFILCFLEILKARLIIVCWVKVTHYSDRNSKFIVKSTIITFFFPLFFLAFSSFADDKFPRNMVIIYSASGTIQDARIASLLSYFFEGIISLLIVIFRSSIILKCSSTSR